MRKNEQGRRVGEAVQTFMASRALMSVLLVAVGVIILAVGVGIAFGVGIGLAVAGGLAVVLGLLLGWNEAS